MPVALTLIMWSSAPSATRSYALCAGLFIFVYVAFGVHSPFLPPLLLERGADAAQIGLLLAAGTTVKLIAAPVAGRISDHINATPVVLAVTAAGSALASLLYASDSTAWPLVVIVIAHAAFTGPLAPLNDAVGLGVAGRSTWAYGWFRGAGSAAFIVGVFVAGFVVQWCGIAIAFVLNAAFLIVAAVLALLLRVRHPRRPDSQTDKGAFAALLRLRPFQLAIVISGLILGSHALHDAFTMIRWRDAGITADVAGALWAVAVAAEVAVFFVFGGPILARVGARGACLVACGAAILRWSVMAASTSPIVMLLIQPLHGVTFALLHLACMQLIAEHVPPQMFASAQGLYATLGAGVASVLLTLVSGALYVHFGAASFWAMAALAAMAAPFIFLLPSRTG